MRIDGRKTNELRPVKIDIDVMKYAEGSALIEMGETKVLCTASIEESVPLGLSLPKRLHRLPVASDQSR